MKPQNHLLSPRELEIAKMICLEIPVKAIASDLKIATRTVDRHMENMRAKIGCQTVIGIVMYVQKHKLLSI